MGGGAREEQRGDNSTKPGGKTLDTFFTPEDGQAFSKEPWDIPALLDIWFIIGIVPEEVKSLPLGLVLGAAAAICCSDPELLS